jgi:ABC-2 type transport system permease protein
MMTLHVARRELRQYLQSPFTYVMAAAFLFINGIFWALILDSYARYAGEAAMYGGEEEFSVLEGVVDPFVQTVALLLVLFLPTLTMRLLAEEQRSGSMALLLSSPVSSGEIVLGKWLGLMGVMVLMLGAGMAYVPATLFLFGEPPLVPLLLAYGGLFLLCSLGVAIGVMASSLSGSQVIGAVVAWAALLGLWILSALQDSQALLAELGKRFGLMLRFEGFGKGLVESGDLAYFVLLTAFFLFVAQQRVEAHRWS